MRTGNPDKDKGPRVDIVCSTCGSDDVRRDAFAAWNALQQRWELAAVLDQGYCEDCGDEASLEEVEVPHASEFDRIRNHGV